MKIFLCMSHVTRCDCEHVNILIGLMSQCIPFVPIARDKLHSLGIIVWWSSPSTTFFLCCCSCSAAEGWADAITAMRSREPKIGGCFAELSQWLNGCMNYVYEWGHTSTGGFVMWYSARDHHVRSFGRINIFPLHILYTSQRSIITQYMII